MTLPRFIARMATAHRALGVLRMQGHYTPVFQATKSLIKPALLVFSLANTLTTQSATVRIRDVAFISGVSGAVVESDTRANYLSNGAFTLVLREADPNLASRIAEAINASHPNSSRTLADGKVQVTVPDYVLETSDGLSPFGAWITVENVPVLVPGQFAVSVPPSSSARYYRLRRKN